MHPRMSRPSPAAQPRPPAPAPADPRVCRRRSHPTSRSRLRHSELTRVDLLVLVVLSHGGPHPGVLGGSPEYLPVVGLSWGTVTQVPRDPGHASARFDMIVG